MARRPPPDGGGDGEEPPIAPRDDTEPIPLPPPPSGTSAQPGSSRRWGSDDAPWEVGEGVSPPGAGQEGGGGAPSPGGGEEPSGWGPTERSAAGERLGSGAGPWGTGDTGSGAGTGSVTPAAHPAGSPWPASGGGVRGTSRALLVGGAVLLVLLVVVVATNVLVGRNAERRAAEEASAALGAPAEVSLSRFPVGLRLLAGAPVDAVLHARDVPLDGTPAALTRLQVDAADVVLEGAGNGAIRADRATFVAELDDDAVQQMVGIGRLPLTDVELANGVARLSVAGFTLLDATAEVEAGQVVFRVAAPIGNLGNLGNVRLEVDDLPLGFRAEGVEIRPGVLRLRGSATDLHLEGER